MFPTNTVTFLWFYIKTIDKLQWKPWVVDIRLGKPRCLAIKIGRQALIGVVPVLGSHELAHPHDTCSLLSLSTELILIFIFFLCNELFSALFVLLFSFVANGPALVCHRWLRRIYSSLIKEHNGIGKIKTVGYRDLGRNA